MKISHVKNYLLLYIAAVMKKIVHLRMNQEMNDTVLYSRVDNIGKKRRECMGFLG